MKILIITSCTNKKRIGTYPAGELYLGEQHKRLMRGVETVRKFCQIYIVSAKYGLISETKIISSYNTVFTGRKGEGERLNLPRDFRILLSRHYDFGMVLLGDKYLKACAYIPGMLPPNTLLIKPKIEDTKLFSCGNIGLKGEIARRILMVIAAGKVGVNRIMEDFSSVAGI